MMNTWNSKKLQTYKVIFFSVLKAPIIIIIMSSAPLILIGGSAVKSNAAAIKAAANSIDVLDSATKINITLTSPDNKEINIEADLYINTDDGSMTVAIPGVLPPAERFPRQDYTFAITNEHLVPTTTENAQKKIINDEAECRFIYNRSFKPDITNDDVKTFEMTEHTVSGCYIYRRVREYDDENETEKQYKNERAKHWDLQNGVWGAPILHVPESAQRIGALVFQCYSDSTVASSLVLPEEE